MRQITEAQLGQGDYTQKHSRYFVQLLKEQTYEDLFNPRFWGQLEKQSRLRPNDVIRVRAADGAFDFEVTVISTVKGAANVEPWPRMPANIGDFSKPRAVTVAPMDGVGKSVIRLEQAGSQFRVVGLENQEVSRHPTEQEAEGAMAAYLGQLRMRFPTEEESAAHAAEHEIAAEARRIEIEKKREALKEKMGPGRRQRTSALA